MRMLSQKGLQSTDDPHTYELTETVTTWTAIAQVCDRWVPSLKVEVDISPYLQSKSYFQLIATHKWNNSFLYKFSLGTQAISEARLCA